MSNKIESMKAAEAALISFANRYKGIYHSLPAYLETKTHSLELFDTPIPKSSLPIKEQKCQLYKDQNETFTMHGIKVTSHVYESHITSLKEEEEREEYPLVVLHGYMNGALYFYRNLLGLSNYSFKGTVYALDCFGWGLSSRPKFTIQADQKKQPDVDDHLLTEQVFVESLEEWRKAHKVEKMTLGGHSMGGHMATAYAEKYPDRVDRLILISPAGVPDDKDDDIESRIKDAPLRFRLMFGLAKRVWNWGVNPALVLRNLPESKGRSMVERYIEGRLPTIKCPEEKKHLGEYLYTNAALPGSGEHALNKILKPTAFGVKPSVYRISELKVKHVHFIYGEHDWMDSSGGVEALKLSALRKSEGKESPEIHVWGVSNAGHLLMLENWKEFNSAMVHANGHGHRLSHHAPTPFKVADEASTGMFFKRSVFRRRRDE